VTKPYKYPLPDVGSLYVIPENLGSPVYLRGTKLIRTDKELKKLPFGMNREELHRSTKDPLDLWIETATCSIMPGDTLLVVDLVEPVKSHYESEYNSNIIFLATLEQYQEPRFIMVTARWVDANLKTTSKPIRHT